jgi:hypothetical protein
MDDTELKDRSHSDVNKIKQSLLIGHPTIESKEKVTLSISKRLAPHQTKPQAKVTILGTDRTTFTCAITMALRRHVSEIVIFDQSYNRQMKMCFHDVSKQHYSV